MASAWPRRTTCIVSVHVQILPVRFSMVRFLRLETMEGKALAIDSSIWIYQFQATMRDKDGRGLVNAHILGFGRGAKMNSPAFSSCTYDASLCESRCGHDTVRAS